MAYVFNPIADPIGFIIMFFILKFWEDAVANTLKLAVLSSVLAFPFALIGKKIFELLGKSVKNRLFSLFLTSAVAVFVFVIIIKVWGVLFGLPFMAMDVGEFLFDLGIAIVVAFLFAILGDFINHVVHQKWQVPQMLTLYVITFAVSIIFFIVMALIIYSYAALSL